MKHAYLSIANSEGVRRISIGSIDESSRVLGIDFADPPVIIPNLAPPPRIGFPLLTIAFAILAWTLWGAWGLVSYSLMATFLQRVGEQAWTIAQNQSRQRASKAPGPASSPSSVPS